jgi:hypothetical protein
VSKNLKGEDMKIKLFTLLTIGAFFATTANAGWVYADNGQPVQDCCYKAKPVKKVVKKEPKVCLTCDYSKFPMAKLEPLGDEKLPPATLKNCGK